MKILVVEDEVIIADNICDTLEEFGYEVLEPAMSYAEALDIINEDPPHLAILDIHLAGHKTGIDLGSTINESFDFPFIFLTSNSDKITFSEAKRVDPYAFLVKPYGKDELYAAIELALYNYSKQKETLINKENLLIKDALFIKQKQCFIRINIADIHFIKSDSVYLEIHLLSGKFYVVRGTINEYISKLGNDFMRCHRSYIIHLKYLDSINHINVMLNNCEIPLGKKFREGLLARLNKG